MSTRAADDQTEPLTRPLERYGQLEVDTFCLSCRYNLHGQSVWLDEGTQILICRCPECGRCHPAGVGSSAASPWLSRLGSIVLAAWVLFVYLVTIVIAVNFGVLQAAYVDVFCYVHIDPNASGSQAMYVYELGSPPDANVLQSPGSGTAVFISAIGVLAGFVVGLLMVTFLWHWPRRRYALGALLPFLSALFTSCMFSFNSEYRHIRGWSVSRGMLVAGMEMFGMLLAIPIGRSISRGLIRVVVPPRPRQLLAFLWRVDGKDKPPS